MRWEGAGKRYMRRHKPWKEWKRWFAWYPVEVNSESWINSEWIWLEFVECQFDINEPYQQWYYRLIE